MRRRHTDGERIDRFPPAGGRLRVLIPILFAAVCICGCEPVLKHKVLTTFLDGVPSMPEPEEYCARYAVAKAAADEKAKADEELRQSRISQRLEHQPYASKACQDCHDKTKEDGLIKPKKELCSVCHPDLVKGSNFIHGPVAVGDCLACHLPHTSSFGPLLKKDRSDICSVCHREQRVAAAMHSRVSDKKVACPDCHDPHSGNMRFFLK